MFCILPFGKFLIDDRKERNSLENIIEAIGKKASADSEEPRRVSTFEFQLLNNVDFIGAISDTCPQANLC